MPTQAVAAAAEPEQPQMPDAMAMVKQFGMLPVLWGANKIDFTKEDNVITLRVVFATVICIMYLLVQFAVFRVRKANNGARVQNPGGGMYLSDADKGTDGTVSVRVYDNAKLQEAKMQLVMSAAMSLFVHFQWGYTQPLIILSARAIQPLASHTFVCVFQFSPLSRSLSPPSYDTGFMQPMQILTNPAMHANVLGKAVERPFKSEQANNPLAQWAERKKAEADAAAAKKDE